MDGLTSIGMVYRVRETAQGESHETVVFITSLPARVQRIAKHLRGHWGVEISLHWSLDVTFGEEAVAVDIADMDLRARRGPQTQRHVAP